MVDNSTTWFISKFFTNFLILANISLDSLILFGKNFVGNYLNFNH